jgi:hypothetical protein
MMHAAGAPHPRPLALLLSSPAWPGPQARPHRAGGRLGFGAVARAGPMRLRGGGMQCLPPPLAAAAPQLERLSPAIIGPLAAAQRPRLRSDRLPRARRRLPQSPISAADRARCGRDLPTSRCDLPPRRGPAQRRGSQSSPAGAPAPRPPPQHLCDVGPGGGRRCGGLRASDAGDPGTTGRSSEAALRGPAASLGAPGASHPPAPHPLQASREPHAAANFMASLPMMLPGP